MLERLLGSVEHISSGIKRTASPAIPPQGTSIMAQLLSNIEKGGRIAAKPLVALVDQLSPRRKKQRSDEHTVRPDKDMYIEKLIGTDEHECVVAAT